MRAFNNPVEELELIAIPLKIIDLLLTVERGLLPPGWLSSSSVQDLLAILEKPCEGPRMTMGGWPGYRDSLILEVASFLKTWNKETFGITDDEKK
ncbi:hypothetical protein Csa_016400 [Cucumis sativus]|uniref:Uncharacterized protein n=1 Tax=Cucumis sativus TaxID=3659 RepID=A0A0A0K5J4_CUCSA|nr:hypothetical protein Csa_016400 [Cucumis sativus]